MKEKVTLNAYWRGGAWEITAWRGDEYLGDCAYIFMTKREALSKARETVANEGGLGIFRKSLA